MSQPTKTERARQMILAWVWDRICDAPVHRQRYHFNSRQMYEEIHPPTAQLDWSQSTTQGALRSLVLDERVTFPSGVTGEVKRDGMWYEFQTTAKLEYDAQQQQEFKAHQDSQRKAMRTNMDTAKEAAASIERSFARAGLSAHISPWGHQSGGHVQVTCDLDQARAFARYLETVAR